MVQWRTGIVALEMREMTEMLARRFTIICLLVTLFGMGMAALVAEASRPTRSWEAGTSFSPAFPGTR